MAGAFTVELRTRHLPTLQFTEGDLAAESSWLTRLAKRLLKPAVEARTPFGTFRKAPEGDPGETTWPLALVLVGIGAAVVLLLVVRGLLSLFGR